MSTQKSPRIVLYLNSFPKLSETFIVNKALGLLRNGWDLHIVCTESNAQEWKNFPDLMAYPDILKRVHISWPHRPRWLAALLIPIMMIRCFVFSPKTTLNFLLSGWRYFKFNILRCLYLDAEIVLLNPDIVHFEFGAVAAQRMYLKDLLNCKIIVSFRGYDLNFTETHNLDFYKDVWQKADRLHLISEHLWQVAQQRGCPQDKPHTLIPPAIDSDFFNPAILSKNVNRPMRILSVGRLEWKKGYEYALQSVRILIDQGISCEYHIVGGGPYQEELYFARHQLKLEDAVIFLGAQSPTFVKTKMDWADIFLHASLSEGFCNVVMEAQSMELPIVASDAGGLVENVRDGETGFIVPRRDSNALAEKMALLMLDSELRKRMGTNGRSRILENFQVETQIKRFEETYLQLLN